MTGGTDDVLTVFVDEAEFQLACKGFKINAQLDMSEGTVGGAAPELHGRALDDRTKLAPQLSFFSESTDMPVSMTLTAEDSHTSFEFRRFDAAHGAHSTAVQAEAGVTHFSLHLSTTMFHKGTEFTLVYAVGMSIAESAQTKGKSILVFSPSVSVAQERNGREIHTERERERKRERARERERERERHETLEDTI